MKCKRSIALLALAFTLVLLPAVLVYAEKPLRCDVDIELMWLKVKPGVWIAWWEGIITGDIEGTFIITPDPLPSFPGKTEHFLETWVIEPTVGEGEIELYQEGVWNMKTGKWRSNGIVIAASGDWMYLIGCNVHVRGVTTEFLGPPYPVYGEGRVTISGFRQILG